MPKVDQVKCVFGQQAAEHATDLARLRISVFREYPYLYDGDMAYEQHYIEQYVQSPGSVIVLALDGDVIVGASTALPLSDETDAFKRPFIEQRIDPAKVFYFGESVLLPAYRGQGIGHRFFDKREAHARSLDQDFDYLAFAAVIRHDDDPRKPAGYRPHDVFWDKRGFSPQHQMVMQLPWKEVGNEQQTIQSLKFWLKPCT
ncbi:MAG: GNAT family N-acetyltransferase [Phycisphaeraceae bacterium JB051]